MVAPSRGSQERDGFGNDDGGAPMVWTMVVWARSDEEQRWCHGDEAEREGIM